EWSINHYYDELVKLSVKEGKSRLEKLVEVPMEVRKVGMECKKDDEEKNISEVKGGVVDFRVVNSLLGEILGEVMGEME
ncbi:hypothetical protein Tco_0509686, partial [Tanacetum coccineum]